MSGVDCNPVIGDLLVLAGLMLSSAAPNLVSAICRCFIGLALVRLCLSATPTWFTRVIRPWCGRSPGGIVDVYGSRIEETADMTTAAVITVGRETFDVAFGEEKAAKAHEVLERLDLDVVGDRKMATGPDAMQQRVDAALAADPDLILLIQATFADASPVMDLAERTDAPIVVWSFPEARTGANLRLNSLCGANLASYSLRRRSH